MKKKKEVKELLEIYNSELKEVERKYSEGLISFDDYFIERRGWNAGIRALKLVLE